MPNLCHFDVTTLKLVGVQISKHDAPQQADNDMASYSPTEHTDLIRAYEHVMPELSLQEIVQSWKTCCCLFSISRD